MQQFELIAPCHFGMESVVKKEIYELGYEISEVSDGRVTFLGDAEAIVRANIGLRTTERILFKVGAFHAETWDELFEGTQALPWDDILFRDARFWVTKASSVNSALFSPSDIQSVMKKAMVRRMQRRYALEQFPEDGASYPIRVFLLKNEVTVAIDTTGESLHKRGYRKKAVKAPIAENLAAGLIMLTPWRAGRILVDPFCGSGTIPIEAAMQAANIAPGMNRSFTAESWTGLIPPGLWEDAREEAREAMTPEIDADIQGYDIDPEAIAAARDNARLAGVEHLIHFQVRPVSQLSHPKKYGFLITNPPYGERISSFAPGSNAPKSMAELRAARYQGGGGEGGQKLRLPAADLSGLYRTLGERFRALDSWSLYVITSFADCERELGLRAKKNRKIYNGMLKTYFYQFPGPKPGR
ncbi:THUMP domain-containing class I SAM-dependent RNA methyltransferase [Lachnoclostridium sp. Marseille-P6806]|uniref:THUMP domain-containing class I SAM-dependent RNA methyltransferase n=1 Tax=Lachnoclostridium sp. Marseille-P6806 TaxID=2364793 RepID=UPI0010319D86|nr:class I SAM-dependent RNA methyltransferase [Lachnoclostridium sp. Marseille-P6806]